MFVEAALKNRHRQIDGEAVVLGVGSVIPAFKRELWNSAGMPVS